MAGSATFYILLSIINVVTPVSHPKIAAELFCYDEEDPAECGPSHWEGVCRTGREQSPVDINFHHYESIFSPRKTAFALSNEYFQERNNFYARNTKHSLMVQLNPTNATSNLFLEGAHLRGSYVFAQLHFHWGERNSVGSEHTVKGKRYPMEVHLVHYKSIYGSFTNAMEQNDREAIAVVAVFFEISHVPNKVLGLDSIFEAVKTPQLRDPGATMNFNMPLRISSFFPWKLDFVRYHGSLTTPTCDEKVIWTVFRHPLLISELQLNAFRRLRNDKSEPYNNFRPSQPINGRPMQYFTAKGISSFLPSIDRIWSVKGGFLHMLSHFKHTLFDAIITTLLRPYTLIWSSISNILLRLFTNIMIPIVIIYK